MEPYVVDVALVVTHPERVRAVERYDATVNLPVLRGKGRRRLREDRRDRRADGGRRDEGGDESLDVHGLRSLTAVPETSRRKWSSCGGGRYAIARGNRIVNAAPSPSRLSTDTVPPERSVARFTIANPIPEPSTPSTPWPR